MRVEVRSSALECINFSGETVPGEKIKRRLFLISLALAPVFFWRPGWQRDSLGTGGRQIRIVKHFLSNVLTDERSARLVGKAYLSAYLDERDGISILKDLLGPARLRGPNDLRRRIARRREQDFMVGDVVVVDGWILAKSEARAAALTVLL
jgi:hypothetical protein